MGSPSSWRRRLNGFLADRALDDCCWPRGVVSPDAEPWTAPLDDGPDRAAFSELDMLPGAAGSSVVLEAHGASAPEPKPLGMLMWGVGGGLVVVAQEEPNGMPPPNAAAGGGLVLAEPGPPKLLPGTLPKAAGGGLVLTGPVGSKMLGIFLLVEAGWRLCGGRGSTELYPARS